MSRAAATGTSHYGVVGHFRLAGELQKTAREAGLVIRHRSAFSNTYKVSPVFNHVAMEGIIPSHIKTRRLNDGSVEMERRQVKELLQFLHQPLRDGLIATAKKDIKDANENHPVSSKIAPVIPHIFSGGAIREVKDFTANREKQAQEALAVLYKFLIFGTSGYITPKHKTNFHHQDIQVTDADEHVAIQAEMQARTEHQTVVEMDGKFIPGTRFNPGLGLFTIKIHPTVRNQKFSGESQDALAEDFLNLVYNIVPGQSGEAMVKLTSDQLIRLCKSVQKKNKEIGNLLGGVAHEEHVQFAVSRVEARAQALRQDETFTKISATCGPVDRNDHLKNLLKSTTALSGFLKNPLLLQAWKRCHYTDRHDAPIDDLMKELQAFQAVAQHYINRGNIGAQELEAIADEFFPLMMVGADAMQNFRKSMEKVSGKTDDLDQALCSQLEHQFRNASLFQHALARELMPEDKREILNAFSMLSGERQFSAMQKIGEMLEGYATDIFNSVKEHPKSTLTVIAILVTALKISKGMQPNTTPVDPATMFEEVDLILPDGTTFTDLKHASELAQTKVDSWHWDIVFTDIKNWITTGTPMRKHYMGDAATSLTNLADMWRKPLKYMMELTGQPVMDGLQSATPTDHPFIFAETFNQTLPQVDKGWLITNWPQDLSHSGYWVWSAKKGIFYGMAGTATLAKLLHPLVDLGYTAKEGLADKFRGNQAKAIAKNIRTVLREVTAPSAVPARMTPAQREPNNISIPLSSVWLDDADATIDKNNLGTPALNVEKLKLSAEHLREDAGMSDCRRKAIQKEVAALGQTLQNFSGNGDEEVLGKKLSEHLTRVAALEVAHTGNSGVYDELVGEMGTKTGRKLNRLGTHIVSKSEREAERAGWRHWFTKTPADTVKFAAKDMGAAIKSGSVTNIARTTWVESGIVTNTALKAVGYTGLTLFSSLRSGFSHVANGVRLGRELKIPSFSLNPIFQLNSEAVGQRLVKAIPVLIHVPRPITGVVNLAAKPLFGTANLLAKPAFALAAAASTASVYLDHAGKIKNLPFILQPAVENISHVTGVTAAAAFSTANFLGWNVTVSDLLQVHLLTGLALSTITAAVIHYPNRFAVKPLTGIFRETFRRDEKKPDRDNRKPEPVRTPELV